ncbi:calcium/sodium antiporter, partial [Spirochaetota bacterium]
MNVINTYIGSNVMIACIAMIISFIVLAKCADIFVNCSVNIADKLKIPKLIIGIVLVSLATTAPELSVSLMAAIQGNPEMALGNAIGSIICDDGLALGLSGILAVSPVLVMPGVLKTSGIFLIFIEILTFLFVIFDNTLNRHEGAILVLLFIGYLIFLYTQHKKGRFKEDISINDYKSVAKPAYLLAILFIISLGGIIISSKFIITSAVSIARVIHIPESIIALTLVAFGTSIPEVATCITAALKKQGAIAVGNIIGADIMNICWVAGASSIANNLMLPKKELLFMFPAMFIIVGVMLLLIRHGYSLTRRKGIVIFSLY